MQPDSGYSPVSTLSVLSAICTLAAAGGVLFPAALALSVPGIVLGGAAILSIIRYELYGVRLAVFGVVVSVSLLIGGPIWHVTRYRSESLPGHERIDFASAFQRSSYSKAGAIPATVRQLIGRKICLKGYAHYPTVRIQDVQRFVMTPHGVRGSGRAVVVSLRSREYWDWNHAAIAVSGTLALNPDYSDEASIPKYLMMNATVRTSKTSFGVAANTRQMTFGQR